MSQNSSDLFFTASRAGSAVDVGLRKHMQQVYNRMAMGLFITFVTAYIASHSMVALQLITNPLVSIVLVLSPLAVIWFGFNPLRMTSNQLRASFTLLSVLYGLSFTVIFLIYMPADIVRALLMTAIMFAGLSLFGYTTKRDLTALGTFCIMGMFGLLAFSLIMMLGSLFQIPGVEYSQGLNTLVSLATIVIFAGLTAWETQATKELYNASNGDETNSRMAWAAALNLYISFIALFQSILQLMNNRQ